MAETTVENRHAPHVVAEGHGFRASETRDQDLRVRDGGNEDSIGLRYEHPSELGERSGCAVHLVDERLTSSEARGLLREQRRQGERRRRVRREEVDALAAELILRSWMSGGGAT